WQTRLDHAAADSMLAGQERLRALPKIAIHLDRICGASVASRPGAAPDLLTEVARGTVRTPPGASFRGACDQGIHERASRLIIQLLEGIVHEGAQLLDRQRIEGTDEVGILRWVEVVARAPGVSRVELRPLSASRPSSTASWHS